MRITEEKGVTLIALVTIIVIVLILTSIGVTAGTSTINFVKFSQLKSELKILQTKVNDLNQQDKLDIGNTLNELQRKILEITEISNVIFKDKSDKDIQEIKEGFRYCNSKYINKEFNLENIKRDYLINVKYRYVICCDGFNYNGITYYIIDQIENDIYNVRYNDKNLKNGEFSFDINYIKENDRWKVEISNINYIGYINNWQVKYRMNDETEWKSANGLTFYVTKKGAYYVQLIHKDVVLGPQQFYLESDEENVIL